MLATACGGSATSSDGPSGPAPTLRLGYFANVTHAAAIIGVNQGVVYTVERVRTRGKARERLIDLICERPIERLAILHTLSPDVDAFRDEVIARANGTLEPSDVPICLVGPSVGPHLGPGCVGAAVLYAG